MGKMINAYKILVRVPEGMRPLGTPRHRWKDIRTDLGEIRWEFVGWICLARYRD
jgi:hypothetical protein